MRANSALYKITIIGMLDKCWFPYVLARKTYHEGFILVDTQYAPDRAVIVVEYIGDIALLLGWLIHGTIPATTVANTHKVKLSKDEAKILAAEALCQCIVCTKRQRA